MTPILAKCLSDLPGISHGFFTREGGMSCGIYAGLNCGFGSNDDATAVAENRTRVAKTLHASARTVLTLHQVHSATAVHVTADIPRSASPKADGLVTATRGLVIGALAADCGPVLFADAEAQVIGAAHSGWKGAVGGILEATIAAMEQLGARRERISAAVGPCISQANYEVGDAFAAQVLAKHPDAAAFFTRLERFPTEVDTGSASWAQPRFAETKMRQNKDIEHCSDSVGTECALGPAGTVHFDLPAFVTAQLTQSGLRTVERQTFCTYGNESLFFSFRRATHRKEVDYGRQISAIVLT